MDSIVELIRLYQQIAEIEIGLCPVSVQEQRLLERREGLLAVALLLERGAEVVPAVDIARIKLQRVSKMPDGSRQLPRFCVDAAEIRPGPWIGRRQLAGAPRGAQGAVVVAPGAMDLADVSVRVGIARVVA